MSPSTIKYDPERVSFILDGDEVIKLSRDDAVVASVESVRNVEITSFTDGLAEHEEQDGAVVNYVFLADVPADQFDADESDRDLQLDYLAGGLSATVGCEIEDNKALSDVDVLLAPLLSRHNAERTSEYQDEQAGRPLSILGLGLKGSDRTLGELFDLGVEAQALIDAAKGSGAITARAALDLVKAGKAPVLLGQPETSWLDAKRIPHAIGSEAEKWEFAKDVAAFANTGEDALIVYGIETQATVTGDVLGQLHAFKLKGFDIQAARNVLKDRLTPILPDVDVGLVESQGGYGYGWVFVPKQPEYIRPVMVSGVLQGNKVMGTHISVPIRVGEHTAEWDATTLHSLVQAGRVALMKPKTSG